MLKRMSFLIVAVALLLAIFIYNFLSGNKKKTELAGRKSAQIREEKR